MPWLPLASARYHLRAKANDILEFHREEPPKYARALGSIARTAAFTGDSDVGELLVAHAALFDRDAEDLRALKSNRSLIGSGDASYFLDTAIVLQILGHDTSEALRWFSEYFAPKAKGGKKLTKNQTRQGKHAAREVEFFRRLVAVGLGIEDAPTKKRKGRGDPERSFVALFKDVRAEDIFDVACQPENRALWPELRFVIPAAFAMYGSETAKVRHLLDQGSTTVPGELVATRGSERPEYDHEKAPIDPAFAQGFDAIVDDGGKTACYYDFASRWTIPWVCQPDLDAYWFLKWISEDWKQAIDAARGTRKRLLKKLQKQDTVFRVTYDPTNSSVSETSTAVAAKRYGVCIEMVPFQEA